MQAEAGMFAEEATARVLGPDPVDEPMAVSGSVAWIQVAALAVLIFGALIWSALIDVPLKVKGKGVLLNEKGLVEVASATRGRILEMDVKPGDIVREGDVLAILDEPELASQLEIRRAQLREARAHERALAGFNSELGKAQGAAVASRIESDHERLHLLAAREQALSDREKSLGRLAVSGYVAKDILLRNEAELSALREQLAGVRNDVVGAGADGRVQTIQRLRDLATTQSDIARLQAELSELERKAAKDRELRSPYSGRVTEVTHGPGEYVEPGASLISMARSIWRDEHREGELRAIAFVPAEQGKDIRRGMRVDLTPAGVKSNEYGFIVGKVIEVADVPSSTGGMMGVLKNDQLVRQLSQQGPMFKAVVELERARTFSGYRWTSSNGPKSHIDSGAPVEAQFVTRRQRLLGLVIPPLARFFAK